MARAIGPDISFYQDDNTTPEGVDFDKMKEHSDFVVIRAGQNNWLDPDFKTNWLAAKKAGIPRGSYWFYDSRNEPKKQAELWRDALGDDQGELPLFADFEDNYGGPYAGWKKWYAFLEYLKDAMPEKEIVLYTGYYYWKDNAPDPNTHASSLEYFHQYPLWIARYGASKPLVPAPWREDEWTFWQYTEHGDGTKYGVESLGIDLNYYNGTSEEFRERFKISDMPSTPISYKVDLSFRKGPGENFEAIGALENEEIVKRLNSDGDWLFIERQNGHYGWVSLQYLVKQEITTPDPDPDPEPKEQWGQVIPPTGLNIREGAGAHFAVVGVLKYNQVVKVLEFNDAKSWVKVTDENEDTPLVGWADTTYFTLLDTPPTTEPDPDPDPDPEKEKWYKVTPYALNVRKGPSTTFEVVGNLRANDVVEKISISDDEKWFEIRNNKDLVGWVYASYLSETTKPNDDPNTNPDPDPDPPPASDKNLLGRFQVTTNSLRVREEPNPSGNVLGAVARDDILWASESTDDNTWQKVSKGDLVGWCSAEYLTRYPQRTAINQKYFNKSVRYIREVYETPRKMLVHVFVIDLHYPKLHFLVTPPKHSNDAAPLCSRTTSEFLSEHGVQIAINGDGYQFANVAGLSCPEDSRLLNPNSYAASRGKVYSQRMNADRPIMYINKNNEVTYNTKKGSVYNAISGDLMLVEKGKPVAGINSTVLEPRTAVGTNQNGRWMVMIVVDGRQPGYSEGCTLKELADMLIKFGGVYNAINLDGGGSSAMVLEKNGKAELLNSAIEGGISGKEREVANHLGIEIR